MVFASTYARLSVPATGLRTAVIALGAIAGLFVFTGAFGSAKRNFFLWPVIFLGGLAAGGLCVWHFGVDSMTAKAGHDRQAFVDERREFANSPGEFPYMAGVARDSWHLDVELNEADAASDASAADAGDNSPAGVDLHSGFCVVNLRPRLDERAVGAADATEYRQDALWVAVAQAVGRCYDVSRDESHVAAGGPTWSSLAPSDRGNVAGLHDYYRASTSMATQRWREAYADAFAVGWVRLAKPDVARRLADTLRHEESQSGDEGHQDATCAVTAAMSVPLPATLDSLPSWADRLRASSCNR